MLRVSNISKSFGAHAVLRRVSFVVNAGEFAGLVGPNGSGKSTLLGIIARVLSADEGAVDIAPGARVAHVRQGYDDATAPVERLFPTMFGAAAAEARLAAISERMAGAAADAALERQYHAALGALEDASAVDIEALRRDLRLRAVAPGEPLGALSGGEQTKLALIEAVVSQPDLLLLDEPTNNLDLPALEWLDEYLASFRGAVLAVSHDRALLDDHASFILELDPATASVESFAGNYAAYAGEKARRRDEQWAEYRRQQQREKKVLAEVRDIKQTARGRERMSQNDFYRRRNKKFVRRAVVLERRLLRELSSDDRVEKPVKNPYRVKADLAPAERAGDRMLAVERLTLEVAGRPLLRDASFTLGWGERAVLIGPNGAGKTTLLRAIARDTTPASGDVRLSPSARVGYLAQDDARWSDQATDTPVAVIRAAAPHSETEARRYLHRFLFSGDDALTPVGRLSYGERRRLALALLVLSGANLLLLDEPTNHLDIPSREAFESALDAYEGAMLAVTHDRYFIDRFAGTLLAIEDGCLRPM